MNMISNICKPSPLLGNILYYIFYICVLYMCILFLAEDNKAILLTKIKTQRKVRKETIGNV